MVKTASAPMIAAAAALAATMISSTIVVEAFSSACQPSSPRISALSSSAVTKCARTTTRLSMTSAPQGDRNHLRITKQRLFPHKRTSLQLVATTFVRNLIQRLRKSSAILLASLAIFFSTAAIPSSSQLVPRAHAAASYAASPSSTTIAASKSSSTSWSQKLNPFRTQSANEMIDEYVRNRLFADDEYDPVESAYREAYADYATGGAMATGAAAVAGGAYPILLAETASSALGRKQDVSSLLSTSSSSASSKMGGRSGLEPGKNDGITAVLIRTSDFLQRRLKVSASISYYIIAATSILSLCVLPGTIGVLYQGFQRLQIDKSEMKMYGKIADMDATSKRESPSDDDDDDDDEE